MNKNKLQAALKHAQELILRISEYEGKVDRRLAVPITAWGFTELGARWNPKMTGAIRRQSMELTRALADLRKPQ